VEEVEVEEFSGYDCREIHRSRAPTTYPSPSMNSLLSSGWIMSGWVAALCHIQASPFPA